MLLLNALTDTPVELWNLSDARDTETMANLLSTRPEVWNVKDAGTTMRFLTAYLALKGEKTTITGTDRMKKRPIGPLVEALRAIGANIQYLENEEYPPLEITRIQKQAKKEIEIPGNISSQYISALLMIAPCLPEGLTIKLTTEIFSSPYMEMTLRLMKFYGVSCEWEGRTIRIPAAKYKPSENLMTIENDWSGASYWYSFVALAPKRVELSLSNLRRNSAQGDQVIAAIMEKMGVRTVFNNSGVTISQSSSLADHLSLDFRECPDLAQTVMVVAAANGIVLDMTGLESLKIKETDRVAAMQSELAKLGAKLTENDNTWHLEPTSKLPESVQIATYEDHRMAMAFAPLCSRMDVTIEDPEVVNKSYPNYWEELEKLL